MPEHVILEALAGKDAGRQITVPASGAVVGRGSDCDILLLEPTLSRRHCRIAFGKGEWVIEDLGSRSGVIVNGQRTSGGPLKQRDEIKLGHLCLKVVSLPLPKVAPTIPSATLAKTAAEAAERRNSKPELPEIPPAVAPRTVGDLSSHCTTCGHAVAQGTSYCSNCGTPAASGGTRYCTRCGQAVEQGAESCTKCGTPVAVVARPQPRAAPRAGLPLNYILIFSAIGLVALIGLIFVFHHHVRIVTRLADLPATIARLCGRGTTTKTGWEEWQRVMALNVAGMMVGSGKPGTDGKDAERARAYGYEIGRLDRAKGFSYSDVYISLQIREMLGHLSEKEFEKYFKEGYKKGRDTLTPEEVWVRSLK